MKIVTVSIISHQKQFKNLAHALFQRIALTTEHESLQHRTYATIDIISDHNSILLPQALSITHLFHF